MTVVRGYLLLPKFEDEDRFGHWEPRLGETLDEQFALEQRLFRPQGRGSSWPTPRCSWITDCEDSIQPTTFGFLKSLLVVRTAEVGSELLSPLDASGQWLPLGGDAEGFSVYRPKRLLEFDDRSTYRTARPQIYSIEVASFSENDLPRNSGSAFLPGFGTVWFESEATQPFRTALAASAATGVGLVRIWDRTGSFVVPSTIDRSMNPKWE
jgi:hypothetical protein